MAKIHILHKTVPVGTNAGVVTCVYHFNISAVKDTDLDVSNGVTFSVRHQHDDIPSSSVAVKLGVSDYPNMVAASTHPDFGATTEEALLANQDIAEATIDIRYIDGESTAVVAARVDALYSPAQTRVVIAYEDRFEFYGTTRNPT